MVGIAHAAQVIATRGVVIGSAAEPASLSIEPNPAFPSASARIGATAATVIGAMAIGAIVDRTQKERDLFPLFFCLLVEPHAVGEPVEKFDHVRSEFIEPYEILQVLNRGHHHFLVTPPTLRRLNVQFGWVHRICLLRGAVLS